MDRLDRWIENVFNFFSINHNFWLDLDILKIVIMNIEGKPFNNNNARKNKRK